MGNVATENTVKRLESELNKASNPHLKTEIQEKINALKQNKEILK